MKAVHNRNVPPELGSLPEHHPDFSDMLFALLPGSPAVDHTLSRIRSENSAHGLYGGALACPIGPYVPDNFPVLHRKAHLAQRPD